MRGDFNSWGQEEVHTGDGVRTDFPKADAKRGQYPSMERPWCTLGMRLTMVGRRTKTREEDWGQLGAGG